MSFLLPLQAVIIFPVYAEHVSNWLGYLLLTSTLVPGFGFEERVGLSHWKGEGSKK